MDRLKVLLAGTALVALSAQIATAGDITVAVPNPSAILLLPIVAAQGEGYFEEEGVNVTIEALNGSGAVIQALASGQAQIGNPGAGPLLQARSRGVEITNIYRLNPLSSFSLVVQEGSGIEAPEGLSGKIIGIGTADGSEAAFARSILTDAGLVEGEDYSFLVVGDGGQATAGFLRGDIDAYAAATNDAAVLNARGVALENITPDKYRTFFGNALAAMQTYLDENQEDVEGFGRALVKGAKWAADPANREELINHIAAENPQEVEDREFANALIDQIIIRQTPFDPSLGYGYQDHEAWVAWEESLLASGELEQPLEDLSVVYTNDFIDTWNQE